MRLNQSITGLFVGLIWSVAGFGGPVDRAALVDALDASVSAGDRAALDRLLADDFRPHGHTDDLFRKPLTRDLFIERAMGLSRIFSGLSRTSQTLVSDTESLILNVTTSGVQTGPFLAQPPSRNMLAVETLEVWRVGEDGLLTELWQQSDDLDALRQITAWQPDPDLPFDAAGARELARFPPGVFLESIVADDDGNLYFTQLMTGLIMKLAPDGAVSTFADLPVGSTSGLPEGVMCLVLDDSGAMFVTVMAPGKPAHGVWRLDREGRAEPFASLPPEVLPNGIARDSAGRLYVADSGAGGVWQVDPETRAASSWYQGDELRRRPYIGVYPPANGIQYSNGSLYVANSDRASIVRIPVENGRPGTAVIHATRVGGDDLAVDADGTLYVTTHPYNSVIRVGPDGARTVVAGLEQGMYGPTAAVFARRGDDGPRLYVVTDGGLFSPIPGQPLRPAVIELDLPEH